VVDELQQARRRPRPWPRPILFRRSGSGDASCVPELGVEPLPRSGAVPSLDPESATSKASDPNKSAGQRDAGLSDVLAHPEGSSADTAVATATAVERPLTWMPRISQHGPPSVGFAGAPCRDPPPSGASTHGSRGQLQAPSSEFGVAAR
jgi:hypothetical protein